MKILDEKFVKEQLAEWAKEDYPLTLSQELKAKDLFYDLMKEKQNSSKDLPTQEALLAEIARKLAIGEKPESVFRQHGDNKHLNYFDVFLEEGASGDILDILKENGISTDILKGIKKNVPFDVTVDGIRVVQEMSNGEDTSPTIERFAIYKDGSLIYEWKPSSMWATVYDDYDDYYDDFEPDEMPKNKVKVPKIEKADGQKTVKKVTEVTPNGERRVDFYYTKKGNLCRRIMENGKFVGGGLVK